MADKDKGSNKTTRDAAEESRKKTGTTNPAHPKQVTKPATKKNDPSAEGAPRRGRGQ